MGTNDHIHGYSADEAERLARQAGILRGQLHRDSVFPPGSHVLEAGCGVGAQTVTLARKNPNVKFTSVDISEESLRRAKKRVVEEGVTNVVFQREDLYCLGFQDNTFDFVFVCFVLEHLVDPDSALNELRRVLRPGGKIILIEGDHGTFIFSPDDENARRTWRSYIEYQRQIGCNSEIGRRLRYHLEVSGFEEASITPSWIFADHQNPTTIEIWITDVLVPQPEEVKHRIFERNLIQPSEFEAGMTHLKTLSTKPDCSFFYANFICYGTKKA